MAVPIYDRAILKIIAKVDYYGRVINILRTSTAGVGIDRETIETVIPSKAIFKGYKAESINGTNIQAADVEVIISNVDIIKYSDKIAEYDNSKVYNIINIVEIQPAEQILGYKIQLRGIKTA